MSNFEPSASAASSMILSLYFFDTFNNTIELNPTNINYVDNSLGWGVIPEKGNTSCWVNIECLPSSKNIKKIDGVYNYFVNLNY